MISKKNKKVKKMKTKKISLISQVFCNQVSQNSRRNKNKNALKKLK